MNEADRKWYVVDIHARSYYGGKGFGTRDEALIVARAIPRKLRPFGVFIVDGGYPLNNNGGNGLDYNPERVFQPVQDM
jgi:hypothetical protein